MRLAILRYKVCFCLFLIISLSGATLLFSQTISQNPIRDKTTRWTRMVISTSGPAKFTSYWLTWPPRLVIEFQSRNVIGKIADEIVINQGVLKKITSSYFQKEQNRPLKSLTFEFTQKHPYKIWQEDNKIVLDIRAPLKVRGFPNEDNEVLVRSETGTVIIKKLEAMEKALAEVAKGKPKEEISKRKSEIPLVERNILPVLKPAKTGENIMGILFWFIGLILTSAIGFLGWLFWHRYRLILDKKIIAHQMLKLKGELNEKDKIVEEKDKFIEQEEILRKTIENTSILKEREFDKLKSELENQKGLLGQERDSRKKIEEELLQKEIECTEIKESLILKEREFDKLKSELENQKGLLGQERDSRKKIEEELLQKEIECTEIKESLDSLKGVLVEKGFAKKLTSPNEKEELWISERSRERREFPRIELRRDYNRTIIIGIEPPDGSTRIKTFVNNISAGGLCFETRKEFAENDRINLRLFFFGDRVPMIKGQVKIIWKRTLFPINYYGVSFVVLDERSKIEINQYIETKAERVYSS